MPAQGVSIIIPCFNGVQYVPRLAASLAAVEAEAREIIFVDDGSTDASGNLFFKLVPTARIIRQANAGVAAARNAGAEIAKGEFLQFLDVDDVIFPGKLRSQVSFATQSGVDVVYCDWQMVVVGHGHETREPVFERPMSVDPIAALLGGWWVPPHAYLVRGSSYWNVGGSDPELVNAQDFDLVLRMAIAGSAFGHVRGHYCDYYRFLEATSLARGPRRQYWLDYERAVEKAIVLLEHNNQFNLSRRTAAAHKLHSVARSVYLLDRSWFDRLVKRMEDIAPEFVPSGGLAYRATTYLVGMANAEKIASIARRLKVNMLLHR